MDSHIDHHLGNSPVALPVICGSRWFGPEHRPIVLRIELPLTSDQMVAALYGVVQPDDLVGDEDLCGSVVVTLLIEGLAALEARAARLCRDEQTGAVEAPAFLAMCRERVALLIGQ